MKGRDMKLIIHGATNWNSSNFGDFLYAYEIYSYLKNDIKNQVGIYEPSEYFIKYLKEGCTELDVIPFDDADYLIYIPGGYFGEGHNARFRDTLIQYIRFMPFGLKAIRKKKKLLVIGVGAGPIERWFMKSAVRKICKGSLFVTTRDRESQIALQRIGVNNVPEYSDMMLAYDLKKISKDTEQIQCVKSYVEGNKVLLVHYNHSLEALEKFAGAIDLFIKEHKEYKIVVAADSILPYENEYFKRFSELYKGDAFHFIYDDPFEMLRLIEMSDAILTCKLHVGVVGCMFNKSVICAAEHPEKTIRFYELIKRPQNCVSLYENTTEQIEDVLNELHDCPLVIPKEEVEKSMQHWDAVEKIIERNYEK